MCFLQSINAQNQKLTNLENEPTQYYKNNTISVDILSSIGYQYWVQGNYKEALRYLLISKKKHKKNNNYKGVASTTLHVGLIYADLKEYNEALREYNKAIHLFTDLKLTNDVATTFTKIATILIEQNKHIEALEYLNNALEIHTKSNFTYGIAEIHNRLTLLHLNKNNLDKASYHIHESIRLSKEIGDTYGLTSSMILLGKTLRLKGNLKEAEHNLKMGLQSSKENNLKKQELASYQELKKLKTIMNQPEQALLFYNNYVKLKDTLFNYKKSKEIAFLEFKNKLEQTNTKISILEQEHGKKKIINYTLFTSILLISISAYIILSVYRKRSEKEIEFAIKEQDILKSQNSLAQKFIQNEKLKQKELEEQLEFKNKQLTSYTFNFQQKNEIINKIQNIVKHLDQVSSLEEKKLIQELKKLAEENLSIDKNWENFRNYFEETKIGFHAKLKLKHENLKANDLKICSLIRLNLNIKETASILGISPGSLKTARYRLRKKLELNPKQEIIDYLISLEKEMIPDDKLYK
ncbi:tetratricopeptide repeat protein [Aquimarina algiphila]|uniref:tetratricopeptide repeat protein n=1 Tax=Aquimarina algiphila TaxID=2047982 RepID=UPI00232E5DD1|nr:tetratricopeptide repeat protein [Aquimarina algiphila]